MSVSGWLTLGQAEVTPSFLHSEPALSIPNDSAGGWLVWGWLVVVEGLAAERSRKHEQKQQRRWNNRKIGLILISG